MERKLVSEKELLSFLNSELKSTGQGENCYFESLTRLRVDDRNGCNWAYANIKGSNEASHTCPPDAEKIVAAAREKYNLK